jgi:hypothetical protein
MFSSKIVELQRNDRRWVQAIVSEGLTPRVLKQFQEVWQPKLQQLKAPDSHWDWPGLWRAYRKKKSRFLSLVCENELQGLAWLDYSGISSRSDSDQQIVYVQRISVAPWNRSEYGMRRFRPVGLLFIREAVELSLEIGWRGRIGLHSLETAVNWYRSVLRMTAYGKDVEHENLEYFEFSDEQAAAFLEPSP